jgi:hypothetical protein
VRFLLKVEMQLLFPGCLLRRSENPHLGKLGASPCLPFFQSKKGGTNFLSDFPPPFFQNYVLKTGKKGGGVGVGFFQNPMVMGWEDIKV